MGKLLKNIFVIGVVTVLAFVPERLIWAGQSTPPANRCSPSNTAEEIDYTSEASMRRSIEKLVKKEGAPRIIYALGKTSRPALRWVLSQGVSPNVCVLGSSVLAISVVSGDLEQAQILIAAGAHPDKPSDSEGGTPLMLALGMGHYNIARYLLGRGANTRLATDGGTTSLHELATSAALANSSQAKRERQALGSQLISKGASVNTATLAGSTPLMLAVASGDDDLVALFLKHGADAHAKNQRGRTAIDIAKQKQRDDIVKLLQEYGAKQ